MAIEGVRRLHWFPHPRLPEGDTAYEHRWLAAAIYRHGLAFAEFSLTEAQQSAVVSSLNGVIALHGRIDQGMSLRLDHMADASMVNGVAAAMALSALVSVFVAGIAFFALRPKNQP